VCALNQLSDRTVKSYQVDCGQNDPHPSAVGLLSFSFSLGILIVSLSRVEAPTFKSSQTGAGP